MSQERPASFLGTKRRIRPVRKAKVSMDFGAVDLENLSLGTPPPPPPPAEAMGNAETITIGQRIEPQNVFGQLPQDSLPLNTLVPEDFGLAEFSLSGMLPRGKNKLKAFDDKEPPQLSPKNEPSSIKTEKVRKASPSPIQYDSNIIEGVQQGPTAKDSENVVAVDQLSEPDQSLPVKDPALPSMSQKANSSTDQSSPSSESALLVQALKSEGHLSEFSDHSPVQQSVDVLAVDAEAQTRPVDDHSESTAAESTAKDATETVSTEVQIASKLSTPLPMQQTASIIEQMSVSSSPHSPLLITAPPPLPLSTLASSSSKPRMLPVQPSASPPTRVVSAQSKASTASTYSQVSAKSLPTNTEVIFTKLPGIRDKPSIAPVIHKDDESLAAAKVLPSSARRLDSMIMSQFEALKAKCSAQDEALEYKNDRIALLEHNILQQKNELISTRLEKERCEAEMQRAQSELGAMSTKNAEDYLRKSDEVVELQQRIDQMTKIIRQLSSEVEALKGQLEEVHASNVTSAYDILNSVSGMDHAELQDEVKREISMLQETMKRQSDLLATINSDVDAEMHFWQSNLFSHSE